MSSKSVSSTLLRISLSNNFSQFHHNLDHTGLIFYKFIKKISTYFKFTFFKYFFFKKNLNILVWKNSTTKNKLFKFRWRKRKIKIKKSFFTYLKLKVNFKKIKIKKDFKFKLRLKPLSKFILLQKESFKLLGLKLLLNSFYLNKNQFNFRFFNYKRYALYFFGVPKKSNKKKKIRLKKKKKLKLVFNSVLKTLYITKKFNRLKIKKRVFINLLIGCLTKNSDILARTVAFLFEVNKSQNLVLQFISFVFTSFPLILLNTNSLTISIKGKFLKKFGNKKVRASKKTFCFGKNIPLQSISKKCSYGFSNASTFVGNFGIRVWLF